MSNDKTRRPSLTDLLGDDARQALAREWAETQAAASFGVIPKGHYLLQAVAGRLEESSRGTPTYRVQFRVIAPGSPHDGQSLFHRFYLTPAALPMSKRDLATLGITELAQLDRPLPPGLRVDLVSL